MLVANLMYPPQLEIGVRDRPGEVVKFDRGALAGDLAGKDPGFGEQRGRKRRTQPIAPRVLGRRRAPGRRSRARARSCPYEWCNSGAAVVISGGAGSIKPSLPAA